MIDYYLRCRLSKVELLIDRGKRMGVIQELDGQVVTVGLGAWDVIGVVSEPLLEGEALETIKPPRGGAVDPWFHINLRTEHNLRDKAIARAQAGDSDIAKGMQEIAAYFISDADGNATAPVIPLKVWL